MTADIIFQEVQTLPEPLREQVLDFVQFLKQYRLREKPGINVRKNRIPGSAKGKIHIPTDFKAPLEDFKEYVE
ncbi:MAG: DUF2281 domain-containing protein [Saprospiraceae bacterium]